MIPSTMDSSVKDSDLTIAPGTLGLLGLAEDNAKKVKRFVPRSLRIILDAQGNRTSETLEARHE